MLKSLSDITAEDLEECKRLAGVLLTPKQIAIVLEVEVSSFVDASQDETTEVYRAFNAGRLLTEADVRSSVIKLAKAGSSPAQTMAMDMIRHSQINLQEK